MRRPSKLVAHQSPSGRSLNPHKTITKSVREDFMRLEEQRKYFICKLEHLPNNLGTISDLDVLLEDIFLEKPEFEETSSAMIRQLAMFPKRLNSKVEYFAKDNIPNKNGTALEVYSKRFFCKVAYS